jgi:hypothetical protein
VSSSERDVGLQLRVFQRSCEVVSSGQHECVFSDCTLQPSVNQTGSDGSDAQLLLVFGSETLRTKKGHGTGQTRCSVEMKV